MAGRYSVEREERGFHIAEFDAKAPELDLVVETAQVLDIAIGQASPGITGSVGALPAAKRVWNETLASQLRLAQVPIGQPVTANADLSPHSVGDQIARRVG